MAVASDSVLRVSARFSGYHGQDIVNVYWFRTSFAAAQLDEDVFDACDAYVSSVYEAFDEDMRDDYAPLDLKVDVVEFLGNKWVVTHNVGFGSWGATINTTGGSDVLPEGVAALGFLHTGLGKHVGRKFFGGITEAANDTGGGLQALTQGRIATGLAELLTPYVISAGNTLQSVVADQVSGIVRLVLEVLASNVFGYQRRRRKGRGS